MEQMKERELYLDYCLFKHSVEFAIQNNKEKLILLYLNDCLLFNLTI